MFTQLKEDKFEADFSQALQKRGLAATSSNFPPANTFIPTLCRCSHPIPNTVFSFTGKLYSPFFRENAELTAELGAKAQCSTVQMLEYVPPYTVVHTRPAVHSTMGAQPHWWHPDQELLSFRRIMPQSATAQTPSDITGYRAHSKILKASSKKEKKKTRPKHTFVASQEA